MEGKNSMEQAKDLEILMNQLNMRENQSPNSNAKYANSATLANKSIRMCPSLNGNTNVSSSSSNNNNSNNNNNNKQLNAICMKAQAGQKIMIIMRGPPGSGKSTLAERLLTLSHLLDHQQQQQQQQPQQQQQQQRQQKLTTKDFIYSTDDYWINDRQIYQFNRNQLTEAHDWNQKRVKEKASSGWSPIIVDNTNIQIWEMQPYVQIAVQHGYLLELLEPQTNWSKSASKLAQKNIHQVPRETIQHMLERYERTSVNELIRLLKVTKYTVPLPQLRKHPPLPALPAAPPPPAPPTTTTNQPSTSNSTNADATTATATATDTDTDTATDTATEMMVVATKSSENENIEMTNKSYKLNANASSWIPYEQHASSYWSQDRIQGAAVVSNETQDRKSIIDLLLENREEEKKNVNDNDNDNNTNIIQLERHAINCPNEPTGFVNLRQMYPNKHIIGLWDLYVTCNGDVDWAVDILIKESELNLESSNDFVEDLTIDESEQFQCNCSKIAAGNLEIDTEITTTTTTTISNNQGNNAPKMLPKPQRQQRSKRNNGTSLSNSNKELQLQIENCFTLADDQYSEHTRKIRDIRNGILDQSLPLPTAMPSGSVSASASAQTETQTSPDDDDEDPEDNTLLEIDLGETLIKQMRTHCSYGGEMLPPDQELTPTKVFLPRTMLKQLYMLWLESVYNQLEEQRQQIKRDDEQFARLLLHPKYADCRESPSNVNELLDKEMALSIYESEEMAAAKYADEQRQQRPNDIATHLTKMKLYEKFPNIPKKTMLEIFDSTGCDYGKTVELIDCSVQSELSDAELYQQIGIENEKFNTEEQQNQSQQQQQQQQQQQRSRSSSSSNRSIQVNEDAKCAALRDFEETRNMAAHYSQLKAECYLKAKQAIQQGNGSVAVYYSEIAQLHKTKIDAFNDRAANCIMEVHKHAQNNPDLLDLHYLHTVEAIICLDIFLDRHITVLRNSTRVYKHVFIITGRGLHSANGVSTIKNKVKTRLGERRLRWQEINPGLLRVKVFSASRHANNI